MKELDMTAADRFQDDSVGCVCSALACPAPVYELPYGTLLDPKLENIAAAELSLGGRLRLRKLSGRTGHLL